MNELNRTDSQNLNSQQKDPNQTKPSQDQINHFNTLLANAKNTANKESQTNNELSEKDNKATKSGKETVTNEKSDPNSKKGLTFKIEKDDPILKQIFNEMGINNVTQIDSILIQVTKHIETTSQVPNTQQVFHINLDNKQLKLSIETITKNNELTVNVKGDKSLIALLNAHLPELKKHLKKKKITIDNLNLIEDENKEQKNQTYSQNKK